MESGDDEASWEQQAKNVRTLKNLAQQVQALPYKESAPQLSHYRTLPNSVQEFYNLLQQGAGLVHATSTKYTLMGKLDTAEQTKICADLLRGCQYLATGCLALHDPVTGCARSVRNHARQAVRAILQTVTALIESFAVDHTAIPKESQIGAQKTGAVWETCNVVLEKTLPVGNRNAMRRDLLTYKRDCQETLTEFQDMIDKGPSLREDEEEETINEAKVELNNDDAGLSPWETFLDGGEDRYSTQELPVAVACIAIVKCSRGSLNATLQAIEDVGAQLLGSDSNGHLSTADKARLSWISALHDLSSAVGSGTTDLGACLYPPLNLDAVQTEVERQASCVERCIQRIVDATTADGESLELSTEACELACKLHAAIQTRRTEALEAIAACQQRGS